jgi:hypothetical protein
MPMMIVAATVRASKEIIDKNGTKERDRGRSEGRRNQQRPTRRSRMIRLPLPPLGIKQALSLNDIAATEAKAPVEGAKMFLSLGALPTILLVAAKHATLVP